MTPNFVRLAVEAGQLEAWGEDLDDDPDSPTCGQFLILYRAVRR
jgi:hypothetical protein